MNFTPLYEFRFKKSICFEVTWNDIPEYIVKSLDIIRHPLNPNQVPFEVIVY